MSRIINGSLYIDIYNEVSPGVYTFTNAIYDNQADATGNGAYDLAIGFIVYIPATDPNTASPVAGHFLRYVLTDITVIDSTTIDGEVTYDGRYPDTDVPTNGVYSIICEPTENNSYATMSSEHVYPNLAAGAGTGSVAEEMRNRLDLNAQGTTGIQGETGIQGTTGVAGVDGVTGVQGTTGVGVDGVTGIQGETGIQGVTGLIGETGIQGATGVAGIQGATGVQGVTGIDGATGIQGETGIQGNTGVQGTTGVAGVDGVTGVQGQTGVAGIDGVTGVQGTTGVAGVDGVTGVQGETGIQGIQGFQGTTGIQGIDGATGVQGVTGLIGETGVVGNTGVQGQTGVDLSSDRRVGNTAITNGTDLITVTFSALPNLNYVVVPQVVNIVDTYPQFQPATVTAKSTTSFTLKFNAAFDSANYTLDWLVLRY